MLGELSPTEVDRVLHDGVIGRIGCISQGRPYVVPVCYAYDSGYVYGHSGTGRKLRALHDGAMVCFEVEEVTNLSDWRSVIAWGTAEVLTGAGAEHGLQLLVERVIPLLTPGSVGAHPTPAGMHSHSSASVYRIWLQDSTGRFEAPEPHSDGPAGGRIQEHDAGAARAPIKAT